MLGDNSMMILLVFSTIFIFSYSLLIRMKILNLNVEMKDDSEEKEIEYRKAKSNIGFYISILFTVGVIIQVVEVNKGQYLNDEYIGTALFLLLGLVFFIIMELKVRNKYLK